MESQLQDWHNSDIKNALDKRGFSLRDLSREAGLGADTLKNVMVRPYPKGQKIIADALGVHPEVIWPSRYRKAKRHTKLPKVV